jgi:hypothetical protein
MDTQKKNAAFLAGGPANTKPSTDEVRMGTTAFDPELLYVECARCGKPVLWNPGDTTKVLTWAGIDTQLLDEKCMIVSEGCPQCRPEQRTFTTQVVRLRTNQETLDLQSLRGQIVPPN